MGLVYSGVADIAIGDFTVTKERSEVVAFINTVEISRYGLMLLYRVSQEEWTKLRESVPYVELYRYNPKHLYQKLNGYGDNGHRNVWASGVST